MKKYILWISLALLLVSSGRDARPESGNSGESRFGVNGGIEQFSDELRGAGIDITREWISWGQIEPREGEFDWSAMDEKVRKANSAGIDILGDFVGMPSWASQGELKCASELKQKYLLQNKKKGQPPPFLKASDFCAPKDINDFKQFAKAVAQRYDGKHGRGEMKYIEILNEVTLPQFYDFKDPENPYELWLVNGFQAIKEGNPQAQVLIGGFVNPLDARKFIDRMLKDYHQYYDIINFHIYSKEDAILIQATQYLKGRMQTFGVNKPVWITETATLTKPGDTEGRNQVARGVTKRYVMAFAEGVQKVFWWPLMALPAPDESPGKVTMNQKVVSMALAWGLKGSHDFHPRPAYEAYRVMTSKLGGFSAAEKISDSQYRFIFPNRNSVYVLWSDFGVSTLPAGLKGKVKVTDYLGNEAIQPASEIVLTESPVFIEEISKEH